MDERDTRKRDLPAVGRDPQREIDDEIAFHLEARVRENVERGMTPDEARAAALERLGELAGIRAECAEMLTKEKRRDARRERIVFSWLDVKLGVRLLLRYPGLTVVGGLAMAFAIAVGAGAFEVVRQIVDPALPLPDGDRIVGLHHVDTRHMEVSRPSSADFLDWREQLSRVEDVSAVRTIQRNLTVGDGDSRPAILAEISPSAFRVTRTPALLGRALIDADEALGAPPVAVIGYDLWQSRFEGDPDAVGRVVRLGGVETTVVGVMPAGFTFPTAHHLWTPLRLPTPGAAALSGGIGGPLHVFGRLADGATREGAEAELEGLVARAGAAAPDTHGHFTAEIVPFARDVFPLDVPHGFERVFYAINLLFVMLMIVVCANVALLMFARAASRESEIVVRSALGASRGRIVGQLFVEALVLGALAALLGLSVARFALGEAMEVMQIESNGQLPFWFRADVAPTTIVYAALLAALGAAVAGVIPALRMTGKGVGGHLRQLAAGAGGVRFGRTWTAAIVAQVAITVTFPSATFFVRRYVTGMQSIDVGFPAKEYLSVRLDLDPSDRDESAESRLVELHTTARALERRLASEPGVNGVTLTSRLPRTLHPAGWIEMDEGPSEPPATSRGHRITSARVDPGYFDVLGAPPVAGVGLAGGGALHDSASDAPLAVVVNQSFVEHVLGGRNAIGRRMRYLGSDFPEPWYEIVGVVPDLGTVSDDPGNLSAIYLPMTSASAPLHVAVHVPGGPEAFAPRLRQIAMDVDPALRLHDVLPLDQVGDTLWLELAYLFKLLLAMSSVALLLSLAGIYASTAFTVERRRREIGIRVALGARAPQVLGAVFAGSLAQVGAGIFAGGCLTAALAYGVMRGALWPGGVAWVAAYALLMMGVCMLACVVPTRRALAVEPSEALRADG